MDIVRSALGHYEIAGNIADADCVIGHSFGTATDNDSVNRALADFILDHKNGKPVIVDRMLADAFPDDSDAVDKVVEGQISNSIGRGIGSWGTLLAAQKHMAQRGLERPLMIAQAYHIGRVVMQAEKLGMQSIVPPNLPNQFEKGSNQFWTRSLVLWVPREVLGSLLLRVQGKL